MSKKKKLVALLSGGLDSPISLYLMAKKGYDCVALTFLTGDDPLKRNKDKLIKISQQIIKLTNANLKLYVAEHEPTLQTFIDKGLRKLTCVMCKRYMLKAAKYLCDKEQADFIINGDILGEQASQTLDNMVQIQKIIDDIPVIRPLIGFEKADVIEISQKVGLYELSSISTPPCTNNPKYPETHAKPKDIKISELSIDYDEIAKKIIENAEIIEFK